MNKTVTTEDIQRLDRMAVEEANIPSSVLMENAARACVQEIQKDNPSKVVVVCGQGNNAGDGLAIARLLKDQNRDVHVYWQGDLSRLSPEARVQCEKLDQKILFSFSDSARHALFKKHLACADMVVDALFGVGLSRRIEDPFETVINEINHQAAFIFSVDIPSGLDGTTGSIRGVCVRAHKTVTFTYMKQGMVNSKYCGEMVVADIGIPEELKKNIS